MHGDGERHRRDRLGGRLVCILAQEEVAPGGVLLLAGVEPMTLVQNAKSTPSSFAAGAGQAQRVRRVVRKRS